MLTREIMGLLALGVLWVNAGLVIAAALQQLRNVRALRAGFRQAKARGELVRGRVSRAEGGGAFAIRRVAQTGRALTVKGPDRIRWSDGVQSFDVLGGAVATDEGELEVAAAQPEASEVWLDAPRRAEAAACPSAEAFASAWSGASKFKGHAREVDGEIREGDEVWVLGRRDGERLGPFEDRPLLVSLVDPFAWADGRARVILGFVAGALVGLVACTVLALWPPPFGLVSTLGGALCLAYFLGIQPLGTSVRDAVRTPARQPIGGLWTRG